jgi:DNA-binding response OmpR family regulator
MHLLVIEDDHDAAGYMAKGLKESGHNAAVVHNGKEGLLLAAGADYDVFLVDRTPQVSRRRSRRARRRPRIAPSRRERSSGRSPGSA